jgi:uncharacterized membrane protein YqjE
VQTINLTEEKLRLVQAINLTEEKRRLVQAINLTEEKRRLMQASYFCDLNLRVSFRYCVNYYVRTASVK